MFKEIEMLDKIELYQIDDRNRAFIGLYETPWDDLFPPAAAPGEPEQAITMFKPGDIQCFMKAADVEDVTDRFEEISGIAFKGNFHYRVRTLADKMSMRQGRLLIVPNLLKGTMKWGGAHGLIKGQAVIECPRKPTIQAESLTAEWIEGPDGRYSVAFLCVWDYKKLIEMVGLAASPQDIPWNWHYGFEINGSIPLIP